MALIPRIRRRLFGSGVARNVAGEGGDRRALLVYTVVAFRPDERAERHENAPQQRELARALAEHGYSVDAIDHKEHRMNLLQDDYDLVVDVHPVRHPVYADRLTPDAVRIAYITGSDPAWANAQEQHRLTNLERRRDVRLKPRRQAQPFDGDTLRTFDAVLMFGSRATRSTYEHYGLKNVHLMPNAIMDELKPTEAHLRDSSRFLHIGSAGQVHKGLDLLLEIFRDEPDLELFVYGAYERERDFVRAYHRELFDLPNVHAGGFADLRSDAFRQVQSRCGAFVLPSCAEGQSGTAVLAMGYGVPCIVSRQCGFDEPALTTLEDDAFDTLRRAVRTAADRNAESIRAESEAVRAAFDAGFRAEHYAAAIRSALDDLLSRKTRA